MKISAKKIIALSLISGFITSTVPVSALTSIVRGSEGLGEASVRDLALDDIAILSNNPFASVVGFFNHIPGLFISNPVREATFKLGIAGHDAGDLRKLLDWAPDNADALSSSLTQYETSLANFEAKLRSLKASDLGDDSEKTLNEMTSRLLTQVRFVDDIQGLFTESADQAAIQSVDQTLVRALEFIGTNLDNPESFGARIGNLITAHGDVATTVRTAEVLLHVVAGISSNEAGQNLKASILGARKVLILNLTHALEELKAQDVAANAAMKMVTTEEQTTPTVADIIDRLADEQLKLELSALLVSGQ